MQLGTSIGTEIHRRRLTSANGKLITCKLLLVSLAQPKTFSSWLRQLFRHDWVVYSKRPFGGPEHALRYLGSYTHRVAISNHRLIDFTNDQARFVGGTPLIKIKSRKMTLHVEEFLRRFLLHLLPKGSVRIRHFGFLANRRRAALLPVCFQVLGAPTETETAPQGSKADPVLPSDPPPAVWTCPKCGDL
jgi:hypothetical protein